MGGGGGCNPPKAFNFLSDSCYFDVVFDVVSDV